MLDFANSDDEIRAAFEPFFEESFSTPTEPNVLTTMEHDLMNAGVLSMPEMEATVGALRDLLIPSATNGELKSLLETGLTLFSEHQAHAEHLAASLK